MAAWRHGDWEVECDRYGGRLTRVAWRGHSLLTATHVPPGGFRPPAPEWGEYETRPVFGYDDCWPSLEVSAWPGRGRAVRDHGELCWLQWELEPSADAFTAIARDPGGGWSFARQLSVREGALCFDFTCTNTGNERLLMGWAGHALIPTALVRDLVLPPCQRVRCDFPVDQTRPDTGLCAADVWPSLQQREGEAIMLILERCREPEVAVVLDGLRLSLSLAGVPEPSLGLWYNPRGYPPGAGLQRDEFGVEWMLTPECLLEDAARHGTAVAVAPGASVSWSVSWSAEARS